MDVRQIARVVHKTRTHVKVILFRARKALGREMQSHHRETTSARMSAIAGPASAASMSAVVI
jgi:hypothetical protein